MQLRTKSDFLRAVDDAIGITRTRLSEPEADTTSLEFALHQLESIRRELLGGTVPPKGRKREIGLGHTAIHQFETDQEYLELLCNIEDYYRRKA